MIRIRLLLLRRLLRAKVAAVWETRPLCRRRLRRPARGDMCFLNPLMHRHKARSVVLLGEDMRF